LRGLFLLKFPDIDDSVADRAFIDIGVQAICWEVDDDKSDKDKSDKDDRSGPGDPPKTIN
jgi:hypothetical protein